MPNVNNRHSKHYSDKNLIDKVIEYGGEMGTELVYKVLLLFYLLQSETTPLAIKGAIIGCLGYVILPTDLIPDFLGPIGWTDDAAAVGGTITLAQAFISPKIEQKAKKKMRTLLGFTIS